jgi:hypothetical protein
VLVYFGATYVKYWRALSQYAGVLPHNCFHNLCPFCSLLGEITIVLHNSGLCRQALIHVVQLTHEKMSVGLYWSKGMMSLIGFAK